MTASADLFFERSIRLLDTDNLVEIDRVTVREMSGSLYALVPKAIRRDFEIEPGDEIAFLRAPGETDITIRIIKANATAPGRPADSASSVKG